MPSRDITSPDYLKPKAPAGFRTKEDGTLETSPVFSGDEKLEDGKMDQKTVFRATIPNLGKKAWSVRPGFVNDWVGDLKGVSASLGGKLAMSGSNFISIDFTSAVSLKEAVHSLVSTYYIKPSEISVEVLSVKQAATYPSITEVGNKLKSQSGLLETPGETVVREFKDKSIAWWEGFLSQLLSYGDPELTYPIINALKLPEFRNLASVLQKFRIKSEPTRKGSKTAVIRNENGKWILYSHDRKKRLGEHDTKEDAQKQERAVQVHKYGSRCEVTSAKKEIIPWLWSRAKRMAGEGANEKQIRKFYEQEWNRLSEYGESSLSHLNPTEATICLADSIKNPSFWEESGSVDSDIIKLMDVSSESVPDFSRESLMEDLEEPELEEEDSDEDLKEKVASYAKRAKLSPEQATALFEKIRKGREEMPLEIPKSFEPKEDVDFEPFQFEDMMITPPKRPQHVKQAGPFSRVPGGSNSSQVNAVKVRNYLIKNFGFTPMSRWSQSNPYSNSQNVGARKEPATLEDMRSAASGLSQQFNLQIVEPEAEQPDRAYGATKKLVSMKLKGGFIAVELRWGIYLEDIRSSAAGPSEEYTSLVASITGPKRAKPTSLPYYD